MKKIVFLILSITFLFADMSYENVRKNLYAFGKYKEAKVEFERLCDTKKSEACRYLGFMYKDGEGVKKDINQSIVYFKKALAISENKCKKEDMNGCFKAGHYYKKAWGVKENLDKCIFYYKKACEGGLMEACSSLGWFYGKHGTIEDYEKSEKYYSIVCNAGDKEENGNACMDISVLYFDYTDEGNQTRDKIVTSYYLLACKKNSGEGCQNAGVVYEEKKDTEKAKKFYKKACDLKYDGSCDDFKRLEEGAFLRSIKNFLN